MNEKEIMDFMDTLIKIAKKSPQTFDKIKFILIAVKFRNEKAKDFLKEAFSIAEKHRRKLIEQKGYNRA